MLFNKLNTDAQTEIHFVIFTCSFSGFEDDDIKYRSTAYSKDPFECLDDFSVKASNFQQTNIRNVKPIIQPKPSNGSSSFHTCTSSIVPSTASNIFDDSLSNGRTLIKTSAMSVPTIIKPILSKGKSSPTYVFSDNQDSETICSQQSEREDSLASLPMPTIPPPPLPCLTDGDEHCSYAIVLFDFDSDVVEDLSIKVS